MNNKLNVVRTLLIYKYTILLIFMVFSDACANEDLFDIFHIENNEQQNEVEIVSPRSEIDQTESTAEEETGQKNVYTHSNSTEGISCHTMLTNSITNFSNFGLIFTEDTQFKWTPIND